MRRGGGIAVLGALCLLWVLVVGSAEAGRMPGDVGLTVRQGLQFLGPTQTLDLDPTQFACSRQADGRVLCTLGATVTQVGPCIGDPAGFCSMADGGVDLRGTTLLLPTTTNTAPAQCTGTANSLLWQETAPTGGGYTQLFLCQAGQAVQLGDLLSLGRAGGQTLTGGRAASEALTLTSTANATKGRIYFGTSQDSYFDEVTRLFLFQVSQSYPAFQAIGYGVAFGNVFGRFLAGGGRGTVAAPQPLQAGDTLGQLHLQGQYDTTQGHVAASVIWQAKAAENFTATAQGANASVQVVPTGATSWTDRLVLAGQTKATPNSTATGFLQVNLNAANRMGGGTVSYTVEATNGTDFQAESGLLTYALVSKAGVMTCGTPTKTATTQALSAGTLSTTFSAAAGTNACTLQVTVTSSLTGISAGYPRISYNVLGQSGSPVTLAPQ
jgi:hypothetical protein